MAKVPLKWMRENAVYVGVPFASIPAKHKPLKIVRPVKDGLGSLGDTYMHDSLKFYDHFLHYTFGQSIPYFNYSFRKIYFSKRDEK